MQQLEKILTKHHDEQCAILLYLILLYIYARHMTGACKRVFTEKAYFFCFDTRVVYRKQWKKKKSYSKTNSPLTDFQS